MCGGGVGMQNMVHIYKIIVHTCTVIGNFEIANCDT